VRIIDYALKAYKDNEFSQNIMHKNIQKSLKRHKKAVLSVFMVKFEGVSIQ